MTAPRSVVIDGVRYVPVGEMDVAANLMTAVAEVFWGEGSDEARNPREWKCLTVTVTDDGPNDNDLSLEQFAAKVITRLHK